MATSDALLVQQMKDGNKAAFEKLFHAYYSILCQFGLKWVSDPDQVEEIVQELFVGIWGKRSTLIISGSFRSYLFAAVRNACLNHIKHLKVRMEHQDHVMNAPKPYMPNADQKIQVSELESAIENAIGKLPEKCKEVFLLSRREEKKYAEIASDLNISTKTVEAHMGKALKTLRTQLKDYLAVLILLMLNG